MKKTKNKKVVPRAIRIHKASTLKHLFTDSYDILFCWQVVETVYLAVPVSGLYLTLPDHLGLFFIHLKLELLTQFPAPNDEK